MVSQETTTTSTSTTNPISSSSSSSSSMLLHQFILSSSTTTNPVSNANNNNSQYQFDHHNPNNYNPFGSFLRPNINNTYPFESTTLQQQQHHQGGGFPTNPYQVVGSFGEEEGGSIQQSSDESRMNHHNNRHHLMDLLHQAPNDSSSNSSRLSLSLGSQGFISPMQYHQHQHQHHLRTAGEEAAAGFMGGAGDCSFMGNNTTTNNSNDNNNFSFTISPLLYSRYLRPAQLLLEEMVNVGGRAVELNEVKGLFYGSNGGVSSSELRDELLSFAAAEHTETSSTSPKRHDLQNQITILSKLIGLLEQVESRYQDYCQRMEEVVSAFEGVAGDEAAKTYTAVALQAMCKHFCIIREAILSQVKLARKTLSTTTSSVGFSRLSLFNNNNNSSNNNRVVSLHQGHRQQVWRPIRGLPETSVAILRAWLFEHFLHPYPNDSEKLILASQTGLTKNQVSNWFINARVRLWKPMIEEMYKDEFGESSSADSDPLFSTSC